MAAGTGDDRGPIMAGRGRLRASHADREQVIGMLKLAFVQGRLTKDELDARLGQTLASRTYADLAALTADLAPGLALAPPHQPRRARPTSPAAKMIAGTILIVPAPAAALTAFLTSSETVGKVAIYAVIVSFLVWVVAGAQLISNWHDRRSRGQPPPRRSQRSRGIEGEGSGGSGNGLMLCEA
jgi:hypothetical protein